MPLLIIGLIFLIISIILFIKTTQIKNEKNQQREKYKNTLQSEISLLAQKKDELVNYNKTARNTLETQLAEWQQKRQNQIKTYLKAQQNLINKSIEEKQLKAQKFIEQIENNIEQYRQTSNEEKDKINNELNKLKASLSAGIQAQLREQQTKEKIDFYKIHISDVDLVDVQTLEKIKPSLRKPVILSKLIWTQYFQKATTQMCNRVLGQKTVCGIYKITNLLNNRCYIGQSVDVSQRWKDHCKCGLGIQASATNKLYNSMQADGIWNFSFELLEECPRSILNEKEKFWIDMYQSNNFGYNGTKGGS